MRKILYILLIFSFTVSVGQDLSDVRSEFHAAVVDPDYSRNFYEYLKDIQHPSPTLKAYQAVSEAMLAQVIWNPYNKLKQVFKYGKMMEEAVADDPENIEIRFLRLAIEYNLPAFLGMSSHLNEDVEMITNNLYDISSMQVNPMFGEYIFHFLEETDLCTSEQLYRMKETFNQGAAVAVGGR